MTKITQHCLTLDTKVRQGEDQVSADMDGEVALMSIENGKYYCLNSTSSHIWNLIEQPQRIADICSLLAEEYDVAPELCESEVLDHVAALVADKLIEVVDATAA